MKLNNWSIKFKPNDLWVGVYWHKGKDFVDRGFLDIYICLVPCLPLYFAIDLEKENGDA